MKKINKLGGAHKFTSGIFFIIISLIFFVFYALGDSQTTTVTVQLVNTIPVLTVNPSLNNTVPRLGDTISCSNGTYSDANSDPKGGQEYIWYYDNILQGTTTPYFILTGLSKGKEITCESRVNDTYNWSQWYSSSNIAVIQNTIPVVSSPVLSPSPLYANTDLICNWTFYDINNDTQGNSTIQWYIDDVLVKTENYSGSPPNLSSSYFTKGDVVFCSILGNDGEHNSSSYVNSTTINVSNSVPTFSSTTLIEDPSRKAGELTCIVNGRTDIDGDTVISYYTFLDTDNVTTLQAFSTDNTMSCNVIAGCQKNDYITCVAYVNDGTVNSTQKNSSVSIINTKPVAQSVYILPYSANTNSSLECRYTYYDIDGDLENATNYRWFMNNTLMPAFTTNMINNSNISENEIWKCEVTVSDSFLNSTAINSSGRLISNFFPSIALISVENDGIVDEGNNITFTWTWGDPQLPAGGPFTHYICNSSNITSMGCVDREIAHIYDNSSSSNYSIYINSSWPHENTFYFMIVNGYNYTSLVIPNTWYANHGPTATNVTLNVTSTGNYNIFTCSLTGLNDSDSDSMTKTYAFYDSSNTILQSFSGTETYIVNSGKGVHGDNIKCVGRVYDGRVYSTNYNATNHFKVNIPTYSSSRVVDTFMTIYSNIISSNTTTSSELIFKSPYNVQFSGLEMTLNNLTNIWEYTFAPNIVGIWSVKKVLAYDDIGNSYAFIGDSTDSFSVASSSSVGGGGGGAGESRTREIPLIGNITGFCGDKVCQSGESPTNCWDDCRINYDTLVTCIWDDTKECNWDQTWFPIFLLVSLGVISVVSIFVVESRKIK